MSDVTRNLVTKWKEVLETEVPGTLPLDKRKQASLAVMLENSLPYQKEAVAIHKEFGMLSEEAPTNVMGSSTSTTASGPIDIFDPIMISLIRRTMPNLIAYDICGVQPMTGPTGLIFALRTRYGSQANTSPENFYNEVNTGWSTWPGANGSSNGSVSGSLSAGYANNTVLGGANGSIGTVPGSSNNAGNSTYNTAGGMPTSFAEVLGYSNTVIPEMAFSIDKTTVTAKERALKAEYSIELAQDLKAVHGLDAETELTNLLSAEVLAEINREIIRTIVVTASVGCQTGTTAPGFFNLDTDSDGRWLVEKFKGLLFRMDLEANAIAKNTRRGKGNIILCSSNVASALMAAGVLQYTPRLDSNNLMIDDTGNTFVGVLMGRYKVYIDPYTTGDYCVVGYRGPSAFDAGLFYCPYVPLQLLKAIDPNSLQPKIGFKTRYGVVANPFAQGLTMGYGALVQDSNLFYNRFIVQNLM